MNHSLKLAIALLTSLPLVGCATAPASHAVANSQPSAAARPAASTSHLTRITDPSLVCMVNNRFMADRQIPVPVDGKTYYGCCAGCKAKLATDPSARTAVDPVTQEPVDKALAVLGKTSTGTVLYFENEHNFVTYAQSSAQN
jgi:YHS domain-containing protein